MPPAPGRRPTITPAKLQEVIRRTTQEKPAHSTQWSTRTMAEAVGVSEKSVRRIWHKHGLKPHLSRTFKVSNDPHLAEKLEAIVGLFVAQHGGAFLPRHHSEAAPPRNLPGCRGVDHGHRRLYR